MDTNKKLIFLVPIAFAGYFIFISISEDQPQIAQCQSAAPSLNTMLPENELYNSILLRTANSIDNLPPLDSSTIQTFDQYKTFVDRVNYAAVILNNELGLNIPLLESTKEGYDKALKIVEKYTPMINSYNNLVDAAGKVDTSNQNSVECFYIHSAKFSLELGLISTGIYAGISYKIVGEVYHASRLQSLALKCPSCVSTALSNAHWFIRTTFVKGTSDVIIDSLDEFNKRLPINLVP